jgi:PAS domain S-box-containing protein
MKSNMDFNKQLSKQLKKNLTEEQINDPAWNNFLVAINNSYNSFEKDKELLEHAFSVNDEEYQKLYRNLSKEYEIKKKSIEQLKQSIKQFDQRDEIVFNSEQDDFTVIVEYLNSQIIKRKETEGHLTRTLNLLTTLLSNLNSGILVEDENRKILFTNQLFCDTFSIPASPEQMKGADCSDSAEQTKFMFNNSEHFVCRINEILEMKAPVFGDVLELKDGRVLERDYIPIYVNDEYKGHLWDYTDITERKKSENKLVDLTNIQNGILNGTDYSIIYTDTNGLIKSFNHGAEIMLGYTSEEVVEKMHPSVFHLFSEVEKKAKELSVELDIEVVPGFEVFVAKAKNNLIDTNEWTYVTKTNTYITVQLSVSAIRNVKHEIIGFLGIARDVTQKKKALEALAQSEERFRNIVEKSTDIIYKTNELGFLTYVNPVVERITGYNKEELLNKQFSDLVKNELRNEFITFYKNQVDVGATTTYYEFPIITKDGDEKWIGQSVQLSSLTSNTFELTALAIDITERKNYEKTIFLQKEKYQNIIANMNLGLLEVDLEERIQYANPGFAHISGYKVDEIIGLNASDLFNPKLGMQEQDNHIEKRSFGVADMYEKSVLNKNNELRWWMISGAPNYDNEGNLIGSIGIHLDITEKKQLELELELAKNKAEESSRAKEAFLANMSHEIRTPLNAIIGMIRELSKEKLTDVQNQFVTNTSVASQHLLSVLNNILDISKIEAGELALDLHDFNFTKTLDDIKTIMLMRAQEKGLFLEINHSEAHDSFFIGDSLRLRQILLNLIGNAIKFTSSGGISVDYTIEDVGHGYKAVSISIVDTGIGIEEAFLKNIFNKFSQEDASTSRKYGGSGLGMAITYELVELMNGTITISSKKSVGTKVDLTFLFTDGNPSKVESDNLKDVSIKLKNVKVLLVEDNEFNRIVACFTLNAFNCNVVEAVDGNEAVEILKSGEHFDIILMDLQMPIMDGFEAARIIRNELKLSTPIIALTANAFKTELEQCLKLGMNDYVTKPFEEEKLIAIMLKYLP